MFLMRLLGVSYNPMRATLYPISFLFAFVSFGQIGPCGELEACFRTDILYSHHFVLHNCSSWLDGATSYEWSYGDGTTGTSVDGDHYYFTPGTYNACLTMHWGNYQETTCRDVIIGQTGTSLSAGFVAVVSGNYVVFQNATSGTGEGCAWSWYFGDGGESHLQHPEHLYTTAGIYTACLTAGGFYQYPEHLGTTLDSHCSTITVGSSPDCDPSYSADFTWTTQGTATTFTATTNHQTVSYNWHFGDDSGERCGNIIAHQYEPPGPYEVCLDAWYLNEGAEGTCWARRCHLIDPFNVVGITDIASDDITIFPIPAQDVLTVSGLPASATLRLFAADGRSVLNEPASSTTHQLHVAGLSGGTYVLRIDAGERAMYRRVVVE